MKPSVFFLLFILFLSSCTHVNHPSADRNVASTLKPYEGGFFRFGIHQGKASVAGYSVKSCDIYVPSLNAEMTARLQKELSVKGYRVIFQNDLFEKGMSIHGFTSLSEKKQFHNNENVSGSLFLRIAETKAKNEFDVDMREAALGVFGEDGVELIHTYVPFSKKTEYLRISMFPKCM